MSQVLSEEPLLLINNLLYLSDNPPLHEMKAGQTIGELLCTCKAGLRGRRQGNGHERRKGCPRVGRISGTGTDRGHL